MTIDKLLITGASGLLGSQLIHECLKQDIRPICLVREGSDCSFIDSHGLEKRVADLRNQELLTQAFSGIKSVIHTAAMVDFRGDRLTMFTGINSFGALFCFRAAVATGVQRFLHVSTVAAVGAALRGDTGPPTPLTENAEFNLAHLRIPYILSKYQAERLLFQEHTIETEKQDGSKPPELVVVSPSIIVAPSRHGADKSRIEKLMSRAVLPSFPNRLNVVDIRDVAPAILRALEKGEDSERYLLTGDNFSFSEGLEIFASLTGKSPRRLATPLAWVRGAANIAQQLRRKNKGGKLKFYPDLIRMLDFDWVYDNSKARQQWGFNPRPMQQTLSDLYSGDFTGFYLRNPSE